MKHSTEQSPRTARENGEPARGAVLIRLWNTCPWCDEVSDYDRRHLVLFAQLLDAEAEGGSFRDMARTVFQIDPEREPQRADYVVRSHLARAHWLMENGIPYLDW